MDASAFVASFATEPTVTYGGWERDPDVVPVIRLSTVDGSPLLTYAHRRKVFETWRDADGRKMGRWAWERAV